MTSIAIFVSLQTAYNTHHVIKKQPRVARPSSSLEAKKSADVITTDVEVESKRTFHLTKQAERTGTVLEGGLGERMDVGSFSVKRFDDERWKNGSWDLNLFVKDGKMDWDGVISAEARRRKFLEMYPEPSTNTDPVLFRSSIIPWWAWLRRFYLPEAEQLNGRAAMVGFFMAYFVDGLTGLGLVDQMSNSLCKACLHAVVIGIILFRQTQDVGNMRRLIDEYTLYDKQWQATWQDSNANTILKQDQEEPSNRILKT